jgi:hypothetical protein
MLRGNLLIIVSDEAEIDEKPMGVRITETRGEDGGGCMGITAKRRNLSKWGTS